MPKTSLGTVLLALLLLLSGCGTQAATPTAVPSTDLPGSEQITASLTPYYDPDGFFSISVPRTWKANEQARQVEFSDANGMLHVMVQYIDAGQTLDEAGMLKLIDDYFSPQAGGGVTGFNREKSTVQDDGSVLVEYSFTTGEVPGYGGSFFEQHGTIFYILSLWVQQQDLWAANRAFFDEIADSFHPTPTGGWLSLGSIAGEYELAYPPGWQIRESSGDMTVRRDLQTVLHVSVTATLPSVDPAGARRLLVEEVTAQIRQKDPRATLQGPDDLVLGGEEATSSDFFYVDPATQLESQGTVIALIYHDRGYQILLYYPSAEASTMAPLFSQMLLSFRFVPLDD